MFIKEIKFNSSYTPFFSKKPTKNINFKSPIKKMIREKLTLPLFLFILFIFFSSSYGKISESENFGCDSIREFTLLIYKINKEKR